MSPPDQWASAHPGSLLQSAKTSPLLAADELCVLISHASAAGDDAALVTVFAPAGAEIREDAVSALHFELWTYALWQPFIAQRAAHG